MTTTGDVLSSRRPYHRFAYDFVFEALRYTQEMLERDHNEGMSEEAAHISGGELLEGVRLLAMERFGLMARTVFESWGIRSTDDFGRIVFHLVEQGEMKKTERDSPGDFANVYDFEEALDRQYRIDLSQAFKS